MASSDDEDETLPTEVSDYYLLDGDREPISFAELPLKWDDAQSFDSVKKQIGLHGKVDNGLRQFYSLVTAWKFDILSTQKPEIFVLTPKNNWIKLLKPKKSYTETIRTILITVHCLSYVKRNPKTTSKALWDSLARVFSLFEPRPSERDLAGYCDLVNEAVERHEELKSSKILLTFLEDKPVGKELPRKEVLGNAPMSDFIVDDACVEMEEIDEDGSDAESDDIFEHVCAICDNGGDLLCCEGKCLRSFHPTEESGIESNCDSLGYSEEQVKKMEEENQTFLCKNCQVNVHQCFVCGKLGSSDKSAGAEVFQCVAGTCGYFYHPKCAVKALRFKFGDKAKDLEDELAAGKPFMCSIHYCAHCGELEPEDKSDKEMQFAVCRRCPRAYHKKCLPRMISFGDDEDDNIVQRAWTGLMPNRILIYCLDHEIDDELATPKRNHIRFPYTDQEIDKQTIEGVGDKKVVPKKIVKAVSKQSNAVEKSSALKRGDSTVADEGQSSLRQMPKKWKLADNSRAPVKKTLPGKDSNKPIDGEGMTSLGEELFLFYKGSDTAKKVKGETTGAKQPKRKTKSIVKDFNDPVMLDDDSKKRIDSILKEAESSITLEHVMEKYKTPKTHVRLSKPILQIMQNMTLGKVEGSVEAIRAAKQKLDDGGNLEGAKAVCEPGLLNQITKFRSKLKVYLAPFLYGPRYTSFGRHFTKRDKLQAIVDKLHYYMEDGDTLVDFCCGANEFSWLMKQKMDETGKRCNFKNYDLFIPKNGFNFEQKDWMTVQPGDLPPGSQLIMGLNPPFGTNANLANKFIEKALQFRPKLLILIVPRETGRLDENNPYELIWEDDQLLEGKAFYLPGSIDVNDKQMDDWNKFTPPLYLWSHRDWTTKHREIAQRQGHLPGVQKIDVHRLSEDISDLQETTQLGREGDEKREAGPCFDVKTSPKSRGLNNQPSGCLEENEKKIKHGGVTDEQSLVKRPRREGCEKIEAQIEGSRAEFKTNPKARELKNQASADSLVENRKKRNHGGVSDETMLVKQSVVPRHSSPRTDGRPWGRPHHSEMPAHAGVQRDGYHLMEHASMTGSRVPVERGYSGYPGDRMPRRTSVDMSLVGFYLNADPGPDFHSRISAEPFMGYDHRGDLRSIQSQNYAREEEIRAQVQLYGHPNSTFASHPGNHLSVPGPGTYGPRGPTLNRAYDNVNTSAINRYNFRLDEPNRMMTNRGGHMQHVGDRRGMHHMGPRPSHGAGGHPLDFAPGPLPPFSQQNSSGWLDE
ncbi:OLC1v1022604C1 [Oldenlandia corymbosa var. corymbosa]|uniref:OLC1v1022604C1 n=1 Tax=Oldenlandia corymbosa var. corymbosa TaxID=529605 RepID=A0AAV1BY67_OLDCO|nr:OLC1v1022604C1 [Oldenlandia corymbosa var. corymbosa]